MDLFRELDIDCPPNLEGLITSCVSDAENLKLSKIPAPQKIMEVGAKMGKCPFRVKYTAFSPLSQTN